MVWALPLDPNLTYSTHIHNISVHLHMPLYIYYQFIVRFPIGLDFLFITFTFLLHLLLIMDIFFVDQVRPYLLLHSLTMSFLVFQPVFCLQLYTPYISSPSPHHMSIPSQSTTSNESCDKAQLQLAFSILHLSLCLSMRYHTPICISALSNFNPTSTSKGLVSLP